MLTKPGYIATARIASTQLPYPWDEWNVESAYKPANPDLVKRMAALSHRANVAMCTAMAEWVIWRFEALSDDPVPLQYLESAWASVIHTAYARYLETDDNEWRGLVRGPMNIAMAIVIDLIWGREDTVPGENVAWMSNLVELVLEDPGPFRQWQEACARRLEEYYPRPAGNPDDIFEEQFPPGRWVPREAFDPAQPFHPSMTRRYLEEFLAGLDWRANPFLREPGEMQAFEDYSDVPYQLPERDGTGDR